MATKGRGTSARPGIAIPPGEHLAELLADRKMSQAELARRMGRHQPLVNMIVKGKKAITAETALQLEKILGLSAETWMSLQTNYELAKARLEQRARPAPRPTKAEARR